MLVLKSWIIDGSKNGFIAAGSSCVTCCRERATIEDPKRFSDLLFTNSQQRKPPGISVCDIKNMMLYPNVY